MKTTTTDGFIKFCESSGCVEFKINQDKTVLVRDGKLGSQSAILSFTKQEWDIFVEGLRSESSPTN